MSRTTAGWARSSGKHGARGQKAIDEALERDERERERRLEELQEAAGEASSLELLQAVYRSATLPLSTRMRAAIAALPFERPKLAVTVTGTGQDFAALLEARLRRNAEARPGPVMIEASPSPPPVADRRFRRA